MPNKNASARKDERVVCLLGGDTDAFTTTRLRLQRLTALGFPLHRAALIAPFCFGEVAQ